MSRLEAKWGRAGPVGGVTRIGQVGPREGGLGSGLGEGLGMQWETIRLGPGYKDRPSGTAWGRFGSSGAG